MAAVGRALTARPELRIGLLLCHPAGEPLHAEVAPYPELFRSLLSGHASVRWRTYDVTAGEFPSSLAAEDGWICSGSRRSVFEDEPWISGLLDVVREAARGLRPFVGICFGHQAIAQALGGTVSRSARGWGVGLREVEIIGRRSWMRPAVPRYRIATMHQDQIDRHPPDAVVLGTNDHCPVSMMQVGEAMLGIQGHPEFTPEVDAALIRSRRGRSIPDDVADAGLAGLDRPSDSNLIASWIVSFLAGPR